VGQLQQTVTKLQLEKESLQKELVAIQENYKTLIGMMGWSKKWLCLRWAYTKSKIPEGENGEIEKIEK